MKKLFFVLLTAVLFAALAAPSWAGGKQLTFAWEQVLPTPNDLREWRVYSAGKSGGPYTLMATVLYQSPQTTYTSAQQMTSPDGQRIQYFFVLTAVDTSGNQSGYSNEVNTWIDFEGPGNPVNVTVTVTVVPAPQ
jgi:hypothetical protein